MSEGTDTDYWFLRDNGLNAKTALRVLAIAYKTEERLNEEQTEQLEREKEILDPLGFEFDGHGWQEETDQ